MYMVLLVAGVCLGSACAKPPPARRSSAKSGCAVSSRDLHDAAWPQSGVACAALSAPSPPSCRRR